MSRISTARFEMVDGALRTAGASLLAAAVLLAVAGGCGGDETRYGGGGSGATTQVGTFSGLFDDVVVGFNFPFDIAIVPDDPALQGWTDPGDILVANYGTSEVLLAPNPSGASGGIAAKPFYDGAEAGLRGAMAVSVLPDGTVWAAFERGGDGDAGGVAVLSHDGTRLALIDGAIEAGAFANPGGICYGGSTAAGGERVFVVNEGDGTAWRIEAASSAGDGPTLTQVGAGLATGTPGNPGTPPAGITNKKDLPEGGARGCAYGDGQLYVADAQNARVVRFDDADTGTNLTGSALEDTPDELVTYPTDLTINEEGALIVISFDNAHAFVSLELPSGGFIDNGLHDLNVNAGNYGTQVAHDTIWFTRANNTNGALRAITADMQTPPSTAGPFPAQ